MGELTAIAQAASWPLAFAVVSVVLITRVSQVIQNTFSSQAPPSPTEATPSDEAGAKGGTSELPDDKTAPPRTSASEPEEPDADASGGAESVESDVAFYKTKDRGEIAALFEEFKEGEAYKKSPEAWEVIYLKRCEAVGISISDTDFEALSNENDNWVWPLAELAHRCMVLSDFERGDQYFRQAIERDNPDEIHQAFAVGFQLYSRWKGDGGCYELARELLARFSSNSTRAKILRALRDEITGDESLFSYAVLAEKSQQFDPSNASDRFQLALRYGKHPEMLNISFMSYSNINLDHDDQFNTFNNIGVIFDKLGMSETLRISQFEKSFKDSQMARANIAHTLINHGFLDRARAILEEMGDPGEAAERKVTAEAALLKAQREIDAEKDAFFNVSYDSYKKYRKAVNLSYATWLEKGADYFNPGAYTADGLQALVKEGEIHVRVVLDGKSYSGTTTRDGILHHGNLSIDGTANSSRKFLAAPCDGGISLFIWPTNIKSGSLIELHCSPQVEQKRIADQNEQNRIVAPPSDEEPEADS